MSTVIPKFVLTPEWVAEKAKQQEINLAERSKAKYMPGDSIESVVQRTISPFNFRIGATQTYVSFNSRILEFGGFRISVIEESWIDNELVKKYNLAPNMTVITDGVIIKEGDTPSHGIVEYFIDKRKGSTLEKYDYPRMVLKFLESSTVTEFVPPVVERV